jgi:hypothetical protein
VFRDGSPIDPLDGDLIDKKLTLRVGEATSDMHNYAAMSPLAPAPVNSSYDLPMWDAQYVITAAIGQDGAALSLDVGVDSTGKRVTIDRTATGTRGTPSGVYARYSLTINLANPPQER